MVWDLRGALLKKGEVESARLDAFEFKLRARTMRLLAPVLGLEADALVERIAVEPDEAILGTLDGEGQAAWSRCRAEAYRQLVEELGDPTPVKLA
ncbi:MAG: hypothetical protein J7500_08520 [Sphingomonas sp.]|uniref:hypothetical protein n=1 Tax=Sphingomonas sp. TaxID=28214 RepID=UPI001B231562|nr:hypothetical protein [Sphingomonas sp.]MBO9622743.1 hypothetical protein [Sphingomonas sp.]